jgi:hypothetical protein
MSPDAFEMMEMGVEYDDGAQRPTWATYVLNALLELFKVYAPPPSEE